MVAAALGAYARWKWKALERASADPAASQRQVLRRLLTRAADTRWGRQYGYRDIRTIDDYRTRVPLTPYEQAAPLWHQAFEGKSDLAWPGLVPYFAQSSGTTAHNKYIPVTREAIRSNMRAGAFLLAAMIRRGGGQRLLRGKFLYLGGPTTLRQRGPCLYGDASGITSRHIPRFARRNHLPESDIACLTDWEQKIDRLVERHLRSPIAAVSACPSWAALLFKRMLLAAGGSGGETTIGQLWPELSFFVSYGMAFDPYRRAYAEFIGRPIEYVDTYSSSEGGMTAIQEEAGGPLRLLVDNGAFYEFIPAERAGEANPPRLHVGEVEVGREYALALSTNGGIWACPLGDVVRFESLVPPMIRVVGRTQVSLSAFGEHVTMEMIERAMAAACAAGDAAIADYTVWPRYPSNEHPKPLHRWIVEFTRAPADRDAFAAALDRTLRELSEDYDAHRVNDYGMEPPAVLSVTPGTFYEWMKRKGKLGGQHKVPRVARDPAMGEELLEISSGLRER